MSACEALLRFKYLFLSTLSNLCNHPIKALCAFSLNYIYAFFEWCKNKKVNTFKALFAQMHQFY